MKVIDFIEEYKKIKNEDSREKFIRKHIIKTYIPYEYKMAASRAIVRDSSYNGKTPTGEDKFQLDTPIRYVLFYVEVIISYTDIEVDREDILNDFNMLDENNILEQIIKYIETDYRKFETVLSMVSDDFNTNNRTAVSFFENKINELYEFLKILGEQELGKNKGVEEIE